MKIGLLGLGTVGTAFLESLRDNRPHVEIRAEGPLEVTRALVLHPERHRDEEALVTTRPEDVLDDPSIDIVVEVMGGDEPARRYIERALENGKSVVTANKEVLARHGASLFDASARSGRDLLFEASVGAGVPVIRAIKIGLSGNRIDQVTGILNGTTNFILTRMERSGQTYDEALAEAQRAGYAEADPTDDVEGVDAARKAAILASIAFSSRVTEADVVREGIRRLELRDIAVGRSFGWTLKPLAVARQVDGRIQVRTHPAFLTPDHPLSGVNGIYNAVLVRALPLGEAMFYGPGAGGPSTASAVLGDVVEAARNLRLGGQTVGCTCYRELPVAGGEEGVSSFYLRLDVRDEPGVLGSLAAVMGESGVSLRTVRQAEAREGTAELVLVTHPAEERNFKRALLRLTGIGAVRAMSQPIRVEGAVA